MLQHTDMTAGKFFFGLLTNNMVCGQLKESEGKFVDFNSFCRRRIIIRMERPVRSMLRASDTLLEC